MQITTTGAVVRELTTEGPRCEASMLSAGKGLGTERWRLQASPAAQVTEVTGEVRTEPARVSLSFSDVNYVWQGDRPDAGTVSFGKGRVDIDVSATRWEGTEVIRVQGFIECPDIETERSIDARIVELLHRTSGRSVRAYSTYAFGRAKDPRAISVVVPADKAEALVQKLRAGLGEGWSAWRGTGRFVDEEKEYGVEVVVGAMRAPADILRQAHVNPVNHDMSTQDVVEKISAWHEKHGVDVLQADVESVDLRFLKLPDNVHALAEDIYAFCPDVVDQGVGTVEALADHLRKHKRVPLWWD